MLKKEEKELKIKTSLERKILGEQKISIRFLGKIKIFLFSEETFFFFFMKQENKRTSRTDDGKRRLKLDITSPVQ